jgi:hypothetical protein
MRDNGFTVEVKDVQNLTTVKGQYHVPSKLQACHTAIVDGYVIEGHVPVEDVERLLDERPDIAGIAVAGMPPGSPGMEVAGGNTAPYDVIAFDSSGATELFARHAD